MAIELSNLPALRQNLEQSGAAAKEWLDGLKGASDPQALAGSAQPLFRLLRQHLGLQRPGFDPQEAHG